jgi:hypothetical protein
MEDLDKAIRLIKEEIAWLSQCDKAHQTDMLVKEYRKKFPKEGNRDRLRKLKRFLKNLNGI